VTQVPSSALLIILKQGALMMFSPAWQRLIPPEPQNTRSAQRIPVQRRM